MTDRLQPVRGTRDLIGEDMRRFTHVIDTARRIAALWGFEEWATPIIEDTRVFARTLGDTSDVVSKEMYSFADRGGESITLRPEYTAGLCRALVTNGLTQTLPRKVFAAGPMFRYERPQKGRYRQFHQLDAEVLGSADPLADAEVIALGIEICRALGIAEAGVLEINTLGDTESRAAYRAALVAHFSAHLDRLSPTSRERLRKNPLRILDSKEAQDQAITADAPDIFSYLTEDAATRFNQVEAGLRAFGVAYRINPRIVRGLDYYGHVAFEFVTTTLGSQGTVFGGGRYDGIVEEMGGPPTPCVGWGAGIERMEMMLAETPPAPASVAIVPVGPVAETRAPSIANELRRAGIAAEFAYRGNLKRRMERANKAGSRAAVIFGDDELARGVAQLKDLRSGDQSEVPLGDLPARLR
jgi:histidyl-tRNA synthetase